MMNAPRILESIRTTWPTPIAELWGPERVPAIEEAHVRPVAHAATKTLAILRAWMLAEVSVLGSSVGSFGFGSFGGSTEEAQFNSVVRELLEAIRTLSSTLDDSVFRATSALGTWFLLDTRLQALKDAIRTSSQEGYRTEGYGARRLVDATVAVLEQIDPILTVLELLQVESVSPSSGGLRVTWRPLVGLRPPAAVHEEYPGARSDFPDGCGDRLRCRHKRGLVLCLDRPFPGRNGFPNVDAWATELASWQAPARTLMDAPESGVRHIQFARVAGSGTADAAPPPAAPPAFAASPFATPSAAAAAAPAGASATESTEEIRARLLARIQEAHASAAQTPHGSAPPEPQVHAFGSAQPTASPANEPESRAGVPELHRRFAEWLADEIDRHHGFDPRRDRAAMAQVTGVASATLNALRHNEHAEINITQLSGAVGQRIRFQRTISRSEAGTVLGAGGLARLRRADDFMPNDATAPPPLPQQPGRNGWGNASEQVAAQIRAQQGAAGAQKKSGCGTVLFAVVGLMFMLGFGGIVMALLLVGNTQDSTTGPVSIITETLFPSAAEPVDDKPMLAVAPPDPEIVRGQAILHATFALGVDGCPTGQLLSDGRIFDRLERPVPRGDVANTIRRHACGPHRAPWRLVSHAEAKALIEANPTLRNARGVWLGQTRRPEMPESIFYYGDEKPAPGTTATAEIWVIHGR